ncbi:MAG: pseudouridine synthase [Patescibacteria group bacterium]|nr:MAG: pseudouridine synthase [Patescibacteria group bacterium]
MRINKYLNGAGVSSRREADRLIEAGKVTINGRVAKLGDQIQDGDEVAVGGKRVVPPAEHAVIAFHKPVGVIVTTDASSPDNVMEALRRSKKKLPDVRLFPVGRLDVASSGLLIFTDDTALADRLMRPDSGTEKEYIVGVNKPLTEDFLKQMREGVRILGLKTRPAKVEQSDGARFRITITEGKNRQIRRMCEALGYSVLKLVRVRVAGVELGELAEGDWRPLTAAERASLAA